MQLHKVRKYENVAIGESRIHLLFLYIFAFEKHLDTKIRSENIFTHWWTVQIKLATTVMTLDSSTCSAYRITPSDVP